VKRRMWRKGLEERETESNERRVNLKMDRTETRFHAFPDLCAISRLLQTFQVLTDIDFFFILFKTSVELHRNAGNEKEKEGEGGKAEGKREWFRQRWSVCVCVFWGVRQ